MDKPSLTSVLLTDDFSRKLPGLPEWKPALRTWTRAQLDALGLVENPHMWIGDGWMHCPHCRRYQHHYAMSTPGQSDCFEVCVGCQSYTGYRSPEGR